MRQCKGKEAESVALNAGAGATLISMHWLPPPNHRSCMIVFHSKIGIAKRIMNSLLPL